jgi:hypothetical protein
MDSAGEIRDAAGRFVKGSRRPPHSGRKPGTPNAWKQRIYDDLLARLADHEFDLVSEFVRLYRSKKTNTEVKARLLLGLAAIGFPKKLAIAQKKDVTHRVNIIELARLNPQLVSQIEQAIFEMGDAEEQQRLLPAPAALDVELVEPNDRPPS